MRSHHIIGGIFPVRVGGARGQPSGQDLGRCAEQHDVVETGVEEDLVAGRALDESAAQAGSELWQLARVNWRMTAVPSHRIWSEIDVLNCDDQIQ